MGERSAADVTIVAETFGSKPATVSSLKSENSTEQLICKSPQKKVKKSIDCKVGNAGGGSAGSAGADKCRRRTVLSLGVCQVVLGALLVCAGGVAVVRGAALSRVGAGLWAGAVGVLGGVVGVIAGIQDCYGAAQRECRGSPMLTAFLALSLAGLACGNSAAVLAATGLHRDYIRGPPLPELVPDLFQDEMQAWAPVLTNIVVLIVASAHCLVSVVAIWHTSRRICSCFRPKPPFDHNQFDPDYKQLSNYVININEKNINLNSKEQLKITNDINKSLDRKLDEKRQREYGSASSKEKLVSSWLGRHHAALSQGKGLKCKMPQPVVLLPAHAPSTLGRMAVLFPPRYATLPLPPAHYHQPPPPPPPIYYTGIPDSRVRRRRSPRDPRTRRRREGSSRESQLTRSLERIHRKRRAERRAERERASDDQLKQTYTGLDRAYAEQYIAVCDSSRSHAADRNDSLTSTDASDIITTHRDSY